MRTLPRINDRSVRHAQHLNDIIRKIRLFSSHCFFVRIKGTDPSVQCSLSQFLQGPAFLFAAGGDKSTAFFIIDLQSSTNFLIHACAFDIQFCFQRSFFRVITGMNDRTVCHCHLIGNIIFLIKNRYLQIIHRQIMCQETADNSGTDDYDILHKNSLPSDQILLLSSLYNFPFTSNSNPRKFRHYKELTRQL